MAKVAKMGDISFSSKELQEAVKANADGAATNYVGLNDDMLDFNEAESFIDEAEGGKQFTLRIVNGTATTQKIQFNEILENVAGHSLLKEGVVVTVGEGDDAKSLTAEGDPRSLDVLLKYIKNAPMRLRSIKFNVSDADQLDEPLKYQEETPFKTGSTVQRVPSTYQDQNTNNVKTVEVNDLKNWILGYRSTILYSIRSGVSVNLTLSFGASLDTSVALGKKYKRAALTAAKFYAQQKNA